MARFGDCGESDYTMITLADLFDLRYSHIINAQITDIQPETNSASINVLPSDMCPELEGKNLSSVPFFYHCENSPGTVEGLASGFMAFKDGDSVLVLYSPENGDVEERFFIIGHADIRALKRCAIDEYLYIRTVPVNWEPTFYCIFDPARGSLLDIEAFENLDEGSPAKPSLAIGEADSALQSWVDYNFEPAGGWVSVPHTFSLVNYRPEEGFIEETEAETPYTGRSGGIVAAWKPGDPPPDPFPPADWWYTGNGFFQQTFDSHYGEKRSEDGLPPYNPVPLLERHSTITHYDNDPNYCVTIGATSASAYMYWGRETLSRSRYYQKKPSVNIGFKLTDLVLGTAFEGLVDFREDEEMFEEVLTSCGETYGKHDKTYVCEWAEQYRAGWDFTGVGGTSGEYVITGSRVKEWTTVNDVETSSSYVGNSFYVWDVGRPPRVFRMNDSPVRVGRIGFYFISGSLFYYENSNAVNGELVWSKPVVHFAPCAVVSLFDSTVSFGDTVTLSQCIANANQRSSTALASAVQQLYQMLADYVNNNEIGAYFHDFFEGIETNGLAVSVLARKKK